MSNPYVGEIRLFAGNFPPVGWAFCDGSLQSIAENEALFSLLGTTYGGDGQTNFGVPDLRGRVPVHQGQGPGLTPRVIGQQLGSETVTLTAGQLAPHTHLLRASTAASSVTAPGNAVLAATAVAAYGPPPFSMPMAAAAVTPAGGSQPHDNMAPYCTLNYIIASFGIYPSQS